MKHTIVLLLLCACAPVGERLHYSTTLGAQRLCQYETFQTTVDVSDECPKVSQ